MTLTVTPPRVELIAANAPFTSEQRDWLNGFFAGLLALENTGVTALSPEQSAALMPAEAEDDDAPWHDQAMPIDERMKLAQGRPLRRRLMGRWRSRTAASAATTVMIIQRRCGARQRRG